MKEQKSKKEPAFDMQGEWRKFSPMQQDIITNFFNAHNIAHLLYTMSSDDVKKYINSCIMMQQDVIRQEKKEQ